MKIKLIFLLTVLSIIMSISHAQIIGSDSRGKEIFNFYKSKSFSLPISAATSSEKINYTIKLGKGIQYYVDTFYFGKIKTIDTSTIYWNEKTKKYTKSADSCSKACYGERNSFLFVLLIEANLANMYDLPFGTLLRFYLLIN